MFLCIFVMLGLPVRCAFEGCIVRMIIV